MSWRTWGTAEERAAQDLMWRYRAPVAFVEWAVDERLIALVQHPPMSSTRIPSASYTPLTELTLDQVHDAWMALQRCTNQLDCPGCNGTGGDRMTCMRCGGTGRRR